MAQFLCIYCIFWSRRRCREMEIISMANTISFRHSYLWHNAQVNFGEEVKSCCIKFCCLCLIEEKFDVNKAKLVILRMRGAAHWECLRKLTVNKLDDSSPLRRLSAVCPPFASPLAVRIGAALAELYLRNGACVVLGDEWWDGWRDERLPPAVALCRQLRPNWIALEARRPTDSVLDLAAGVWRRTTRRWRPWWLTAWLPPCFNTFAVSKEISAFSNGLITCVYEVKRYQKSKQSNGLSQFYLVNLNSTIWMVRELWVIGGSIR